jgi:S1/P1 Nuclease
LLTKSAAASQTIRDIRPTDWVLQADDLSRDVAYRGLNHGDDLDEAYIAGVLPIVRDQLLLGGIRLAKVLDEIFGTSP